MTDSHEVSHRFAVAVRAAGWLMVASALWSGLSVLQLLALGHTTSLVDGVQVGSDWSAPWVFVAMALVSLASSVASATLLRRGAVSRARVALVLVAVSGWVTVLSTAASLACLWITRDRR